MSALLIGGCGSDDGVTLPNPPTNPQDGPPAGNGDGACSILAEAGLEDVSSPTTIVGDGTAASCTAEAFHQAIAKSGVITFDCGPDSSATTTSIRAPWARICALFD